MYVYICMCVYLYVVHIYQLLSICDNNVNNIYVYHEYIYTHIAICLHIVGLISGFCIVRKILEKIRFKQT